MSRQEVSNLKRKVRNRELLLNGLTLLVLILLVFALLYIISPAIEKIFYD